jgi:hypothetical protein
MMKASAVAKAKKKIKKGGEKDGKPEKVETETAAGRLVRALLLNFAFFIVFFCVFGL